MTSRDQRSSDDKNNMDQPVPARPSKKESKDASKPSTGPSAAEKIRESVVASIDNNRGQQCKAASSSSSSSAAATVKMASSAAAAQHTARMRRESIILSQFSTGSNGIDDGSNNDTGENTSNGIDSDSVGGNTLGGMSRLGLLGSQQSQPTWMPDDDRSSSTNMMLTPAPQPNQPQPQQPSSISLFGAVMRQFGSNNKTKTTTKTAYYSSPGSKRTTFASSININQESKDNEGDDTDNANNNSSTVTGTFSRLMGSPSGKSIMNLLTSFNSPFKFQSPKSRNNRQIHRGAKRRLDLGSPRGKSQHEEEDDPTGERVKRARLGDQEDNHLRAADKSSDGDDDDDEAWREVPVFEFQDGTNATGSSVKAQEEVPFLDWSLKARIRMEWHNHDENPIADGRQLYVDPWATHEMTSSTAWKEAATYYEFQSTATPPKIAITRTKTALRRESSIGSVGSGSRHVFGTNAVAASSTATISTSSSLEFAKQLVRTVRGSQVQFSRQMCMDGRSTLQPGLLLSDTVETQLQPREVSVVERQQRRQWRQAFRSLYLNYRRYSKQCSNAMNAMLDCYFYCIGEGHVVLFRIDIETANSDFDECNDNGDTRQSSSLPTVLISGCSAAFRQKLASRGLSASDSGHASGGSSAVDPDKIQFEYLKDVTNNPPLSQMSTEGKDVPSSPSPSAKKAALLSPSTKADLEALRRAQTFGESAGADVFVKIKRNANSQSMKQQAEEDKNLKPRAIRLSGWDQVALFFEVYLNSYGAVREIGDEDSPTRLPTLVCHHRLGPFDNCMMKRLTVFPVVEEQQTLDNNAAPKATNTIDVCGIVLPSALRQLVLAAAKHTAAPAVGNIKASQYLVMHTFRPKNIPRSLRGLEGSLVLNQGMSNTKSDPAGCSECPNGKVLQLAVWDSTSTRNVVAFRLETATLLSIEGSLLRK